MCVKTKSLPINKDNKIIIDIYIDQDIWHYDMGFLSSCVEWLCLPKLNFHLIKQ